MSRRGSLNPNVQRGKGLGYDTNKRRPSGLKEDTKTRNSIAEATVIKDGDIYYRTVKSFPSVPELGEEIILTVTKSYDPNPVPEKTPGGGGGPSTGRKSAQDSRRGSNMPERAREDSVTASTDDFGR